MKRAENWKVILLLGAGLSLGGGLAASGADLSNFDGLVEQWMNVRATIAEERRAWADQRGQWLREQSLLQQESETLARRIDADSGQATSVERERAAILARKEAMEGVLERVEDSLDRAETELTAWRRRIPEGLRRPLAGGFRALPDTPEEAAKRSVTQRAQAVIAVSTQIENLLHGFHATRETLEVANGTRRQVEVLYVGLARAFAVSPGNDWAAVGVPTEEGWLWRPQVERAADIRAALDVFQRRQTAQLVSLPMQVAGAGEP